MDRIKGHSTGSKIVLGCGILLFFSLFFTWQNLQVDFGHAGIATLTPDGWDFWGLVVGLVTLTVITLVVVVHATEVDLSEEIPWEGLILALAGALLGLVLLKNLTRRLGVDELSRACLIRGRGRRLASRLVERTRLGASVNRLSRSTRSSPDPS